MERKKGQALSACPFYGWNESSLPMFPFRVSGPSRAVGSASPRSLMPLVQFACSSEYVSGHGIAVLVERSPLGLRRDDGALGVFPRPPATRISQCASASLVDFALLQGAFPNRTAGLASGYSLDLRRALTCCSASYSHEVLSPTALETWAATNTGIASPGCATPSAFLRPLTLYSARGPPSFDAEPVLPALFHADDAHGVPPSEVSLPNGPLGLSTSLPLSTFTNRCHRASSTTSILALHC